MKKLLTTVFFLSPFLLGAQNVGIGTTAPSYKLQVHNPDGANNYMSITNTTTGSTVNDGLVIGLTGSSAILANVENGSLSLGTNNLTRIMINAAGDVGIGALIPGAKLHVNGGIKLEGLNLFEFGAGVAGKEVNAGKVGYNAFGTNALAFVGAGTDASNRAVYFFAEGGTTFSGPALVTGNMNIGGQLQVNGSPGAAGQVLTSNGISDPTWSEAAYGNTTRFAVYYQEAASVFDEAVISSTKYNLNPANVVIGTTTITINQSGLYHFDIGVSGSLAFAATTAIRPTFDLSLYTSTGVPISLIRNRRMDSPTYSLAANYVCDDKVSVDIYITAGNSIRLGYGLNTLGIPGGSTSHNLDAFITCYLINN